MTNTLLVDDDEVERLGREVILRRLGLGVRATAWSELGLGGPATDALAMLVVRRDTDRWDRFQVLRSAGDLRAVLGPRARIVALVDAPAALDPIIGLRLAGAGVDEVLPLRRVRSASELGAVASGVVVGPSPAPTATALAWTRIGGRCNPDRVVGRVLEMAECDPSFLRAFDPGVQQNECGLSRRRAHTLRIKVSELGDLHPAPGRSMGGPVRDQSLPRWSEMVDFVNRCRGWTVEDDRDRQTEDHQRPMLPSVAGRWA